MNQFKLLFFMAVMFFVQPILASRPDYGYIFAYATEKNDGRNGLHFAWSIDQVKWHPIGPEHGYVKSDYGAWGSQKRMIAPILFRGPNQLWHCIWGLNDEEGVFAHVASPDLVYWGRQSYQKVSDNQNCRFPEVVFDSINSNYMLTWISDRDGTEKILGLTTNNFKEFSPAKTLSSAERNLQKDSLIILGVVEMGTIHKVEWSVIDELIKAQQLVASKNKLWDETMKDDPVRFANLKSLEASVNVKSKNEKEISNLLMGIFFEDINYAADGGIYAELVQNRGFEYDVSDKKGRDQQWNSTKAWSIIGDGASMKIETENPVHDNNKHYALLELTSPGAALVNEGWDGIVLAKGDKYDFSVFAKRVDGSKGYLQIRLTGADGQVYAEGRTGNLLSGWKKYELVLTSNASVSDARLELMPQSAGKFAVDMVSLFPQNTFKGRKNGLRADLAQAIADIHPRFIRFPGGCVAHGDGLDNMYRWKNTIGPLEERVPQRNIWNYHQSAGLGYFEYFQFCADIGAEPIPVVAAGVPCQNSSMGGSGQQGGIPLCEMDDYVQEVLDLIEWANGDPKSKWGKVRADAGRKEPFNLKYIGIGNEDLITDVFEERFTQIYNAVKEKYPDITIIGTVGPFHEGTDYVEGWMLADKLNIPVVDEHYYASPGWYIHNQDYYDKYDRNKSKVYLGEYAAHLPGRPNNIETALAEALHLTTLERNADVVIMSSYAPLLAKERYTQWNPNLIYFNNTEVKPTVGYYVQKLFGTHAGDRYIPSEIVFTNYQNDVNKRFATSVVRDSKSGDVIVKLVNLLPVEVNTSLDISDLSAVAGKASKTVLQGTPDDRKAMPLSSEIDVADKFVYSVPPYSFTVIRLKTK